MNIELCDTVLVKAHIHAVLTLFYDFFKLYFVNRVVAHVLHPSNSFIVSFHALFTQFNHL